MGNFVVTRKAGTRLYLRDDRGDLKLFMLYLPIILPPLVMCATRKEQISEERVVLYYEFDEDWPCYRTWYWCDLFERTKDAYKEICR